VQEFFFGWAGGSCEHARPNRAFGYTRPALNASARPQGMLHTSKHIGACQSMAKASGIQSPCFTRVASTPRAAGKQHRIKSKVQRQNAKYGRRAQFYPAAILYTGMARQCQKHRKDFGQAWRRKYIAKIWANPNPRQRLPQSRTLLQIHPFSIHVRRTWAI